MFNVQLVIKIHKRSSPWQVSDAAFEEGLCCMNWGLYMSVGTDENNNASIFEAWMRNANYYVETFRISVHEIWNVV